MSDQPEEDTFSERLDVDLWKKVFQHAKPHKRLILPLAISAVIIAIADASFALITRWAVDDVVEKGTDALFGPHIAVYVIAAVALSLGVLIFIIKAGGLANHMSHDIRQESFERLQQLEFAYFDHRPHVAAGVACQRASAIARPTGVGQGAGLGGTHRPPTRSALPHPRP